MNNAKLLLSVNDAANTLSVSVSTINRLARDGKLRYVRIGNRVLFKQSELESYVEKLAAGDVSVQPKKRGRPRLSA